MPIRLRRLLPMLLIALAIPLTAGAAPASARTFTKCGDHIENGSGWFNLRTANTACSVARELADHYVFEAGGNDDGFKRWNCNEEQIGDEVWRVKCHRKKKGTTVKQRVRFRYGA